MAYNSANLSVLAYANNFTLWHYTTTDSSITGSGYFNSAAQMLRLNDLLITNTSTGGSPATKFYIVTGNDGSTVTVTLYS